MKKCDYCGEEHDEKLFGTLDNGSEACYQCIKIEENRIAKRENKFENNKEELK